MDSETIQFLNSFLSTCKCADEDTIEKAQHLLTRYLIVYKGTGGVDSVKSNANAGRFVLIGNF